MPEGLTHAATAPIAISAMHEHHEKPLSIGDISLARVSSAYFLIITHEAPHCAAASGIVRASENSG